MINKLGQSINTTIQEVTSGIPQKPEEVKVTEAPF